MNNRDFRRELEERERLANISKERERGRGRITDKEKEEVDKPPKRLKIEQNLDADDPLDESDAGDSDSDSDDDETAALMAELQKIKREKAAEEKEKVMLIIVYSVFRSKKKLNNLELWLSSSNQGIAIGAEVFCFFECLHTAWNTRANHTAKTEECNTSDPSINAGFTFHFRCHFL